MTKCFELLNTHYKFHIIINTTITSYIIISWLKHQPEFVILVQLVMPQWKISVKPHPFFFFFPVCLVTETKGQTFCGIPGFHSTSGTVDYTAVIFSTHLVAMKCEIFTTTSIRGTQLCIQPATQLTHSPLLPANHVCQSTAHAQRLKWQGCTEWYTQNVKYCIAGHLLKYFQI